MSKVCTKCGREYGNSSVKCAICKLPLEENEIDNSEQARMERLHQMQEKRTLSQALQKIPQRSSQQQIQHSTKPIGKSSPTVVQKEGPSGLSISALVFSLLGCISIVGLILGIVDLCVNKQRKKVCSVLALVFSGLWIVGMTAFIGGRSNSNRPGIANSSTGTPFQSSSMSANNNIGWGSDSAKGAYGLMETAQANNIKVTMTKYEESSGHEWNVPSSGNIFVLVEFEIENNSTSDLAVSSIMSFDAYVDNYSVNYSFGALMEKSDETQLDGTVASGKKMRGWIGWEVPADWSELEVHFTDNVWFGDDIKFLINK